MRIKDLISAGYKSFYSLLDVVKKRIDFDNVPQNRMKLVIEGRYNAFTVASETLNKIRDLQEGLNIFDEEEYKKNISELIDSTDVILIEILKVLEMKIDVNDETAEDTDMKGIVMSKKAAFDFLLEIDATKDNLLNVLKAKDIAAKRKNLATARVKSKFV